MITDRSTGLTVNEFLVLVKLYFRGGKKAVETYQRGVGTAEEEPSPSLGEAELSFARGAWKWLVARPNVIVGGNRRYNKLALDDILALPDKNQPTELVNNTAQGDAGTTESASSTSNVPAPKPLEQKSKSSLSVRPLLYVTEETIWRAIAGHGVDYKRIPKLEWQLLQVIAQSKHEGILQGELRQKSGQDKRSVPKRTDFLAAKGYIAKRSIMVRKSKTSKLWLASLAPSTTETTKESLATNYDMSKAALTRDLSPVPWHTKWTGTDIDVETFAESIIIICKAWGVIRYADMRLKMGVEELRWQMRVMARLCRNLVDMGLLKYTAATFSNQKKVWKDCIKFLRDPSESEWSQILATGKKTSKYSDLTKDRQPKPLALSMTNTPAEASQTPVPAKEGEETAIVGAPPTQLVSRGAVGWVPEKPLAHTLFDTIEAAGPGGASNPQISAATVGYNFRRYIGTMLTNIATCQQPPHLRKFQINRELVRRDKTTTFIYTADSTTRAKEPTQDVQEMTQQPTARDGEAADAPDATASVQVPVSQAALYGFGPIQPEKVAEPTASLSDISKRLKGRNRSSNKAKKTRNREVFATPAQDSEDRLAKRRKLDNDDGTPAPGVPREATVEEVVQPKGDFMPGCPFEFLPGKPNGVYRGEPNSLRKQRGGRPKKSLVLIFRLERMKNEGFWAPRMPLGPQEVFLRVKYQGANGELRLHKGTKSVTFFSRPALPEDDIPKIDLEGLDEDPSLQAGTEEEDSAIVFGRKENGETPARVYKFVLKKDDATQREAEHILEQIRLVMHPPPPPEEPTVTDAKEDDTVTLDADASMATEAPATEQTAAPQTTTKGKGKKKGVRKRDIKCWKCDKCGGTWKNDIGLKYHLEKAQVSCNPNFVAAPPMPKKKRRQSVTPPPSLLQNRAGSEVPEADMGTGHASSGRPVRRAATAARRAEEVDEDDEPQVNVIMPRRRGPKPRYIPRLYDAGTPSFRGLTVDPIITETGQQEATPRRERLPRLTEPGDYTTVPKLVLSPSQARAATPVPSQILALSTPRPTEIAQLAAPNEPVTEKTAAPAVPVAEPTSTPAPTSAPRDKGPGDSDSGGTAKDTSEVVAEKAVVVKGRTALPDSRPSAPEVARKYPAFKPGEYIHHHTESKMRTAQCGDIIEYLLDCNGGVFPGDKALFFAMLKVFLQSFPDQTPPSLRSCSAAVRRLNSKNKAREIVHAFRHKGKFVTCNMLVATDIDVKDEGPTALKRKMQDAFPKVYIPASFSPTQEELQIIDQIDPKDIAEGPPHLHNTEKFRKRREEVEVEILDAPFYQDHPNHMPRQFLNVNDTPENRRKRRTNAEMAAAEAEPPAKKRKSIGTKMLKNADEAGDEPEDLDMMDWDAEQPDIAGAIRQFGLLPTQKGGKKRLVRVVAVMNKLDPADGRLQNPGLDSLPAVFFSNKAAKPVVEVDLHFLPPNTRLEDSCDWFEDAFISETAQASSLLTKPTYEVIMPPRGAMEPVEEYRFTTSCTTLHESSPATWPSQEFPYINTMKKQDEETSFTMQGWFPSRQWFFLQSLPTDVNHMASMVKGKHIDPSRYQDPVYGAFCDTVDRCARWEQSEGGSLTLMSGTVAPDYIYINFGTPYGRVKKAPFFNLEWSDETQFAVDTMPWDDLDAMNDIDDDDEDGSKKLSATLLKRPRGRPKTKTPKKAKTDEERKPMGRRPKKNRLPAIAKQRAHTAYPQSQDAYMEVHRGEDRTKEWNSEHTQLAAFVCVTTLLGGVSKAVDWGLMMRLFPDVSLSHLRKFWGDLNKDRKSTIIDLTEKFQKAFLAAYETGEVPPLNYDSYIDYDWIFLVNWTKGLAGTISDLPGSYDQLDKNGLIVSDQTYQPRDWRETFWIANRSLYNRFQDASSQAISMPLESQTDKKDEDNQLLLVAQSWVRALCVTDRTHSENVISRRWASFMGLPRDEISELINDAVQKLQDAYVITKDKGPSSIRLNDRVVKLLDKSAQELKFAEAAAFKRRLDKTFRKGKKHRVRYQADKDGHTLALLNLQAHGRVKLETENKFVPLGYVPYNYETRKYNKKHHHFRLYAVPSDTYLYSAENELQQMPDEQKELIHLLDRIQSTDPPDEGPLGELPIWCDFLGVVDEHRWRKCLGAVLFLLSVRGPMRAQAASEQLKFLMPFEVQLILDWADGLGLMRQMTPEAPKSLTEWWWLAVDTQRRRTEVDGGKGKGVVDSVEEEVV